MTNHITLNNLIELNRVLVNQFGDGPPGVKDRGTLEFIVEKASMSKDLHKEASILLFEINTKHPFWGANKRTAFEAAKIFLLSNDIRLKVEFGETVNFVNKIAEGKINYDQTLKWVRDHVVK